MYQLMVLQTIELREHFIAHITGELTLFQVGHKKPFLLRTRGLRLDGRLAELGAEIALVFDHQDLLTFPLLPH